jgi:hypothetical protein
MKIKNARLLATFRTPGFCEICNLYVAKREPHHLWRRTPEISIRINLISLGALVKMPDGRERFLCGCHRMIHDSKIPASRVLSIVALRENCTPEDIEEVMHWLRRLVRPTALRSFSWLCGTKPQKINHVVAVSGACVLKRTRCFGP